MGMLAYAQNIHIGEYFITRYQKNIATKELFGVFVHNLKCKP